MALETEKGKITIVGQAYAHKGSEFVYTGIAEACKACSVNKVCHNLVPGRRYQVISVRDPVHACFVHEGGAQTVEVVPAMIRSFIVLSDISSVCNTSFIYNPPCNERCEYAFFCFSPGLIKGQRYIIREAGFLVNGIGKEIRCPIGKSRTSVLLELLPDELPRFGGK
jgi:uncharacterized protein (UPF0179 family)